MIEIVSPGRYDLYCDDCEKGVIHVVAIGIPAALMRITHVGWRVEYSVGGGAHLICSNCVSNQTNGVVVL